MRALKAHVQDGRIVVDESTDLPDGTELYVVPLRAGDDLDDDERAALHAALREAEGELDRGEGLSEAELWARLRAIP